MSAIGKILASLIVLVITAFVAGSVFAPGVTSSLVGQALGQTAPEPSDQSLDDAAEAITGDPYPGDPAAEAKLVDKEATRLVAVRTAASAGPSKALDTTVPFLVATVDRPTLVLPARETPYRLAELAKLAPETLSADGPDGAFVLHHHLAVMESARLAVGAGEHLLLAGGRGGFSSVVALGGSLDIRGTSDSRAEIASWDASTGAADETTSDGRPYLRVIGGSLAIEDADISSLGFWSGDTGGISYDGRQSPDVEAVPSKRGGDVPTVTLTRAEQTAPQLKIRGAVVRGNVFGLTVTGADGAAISRSEFSRSLADGLVLDREVTGTAITETTVSGNARDGVVVSPSCDSTALKDLEVEGNGRNGLLLDGRPVADGPSVSGASTATATGTDISGGTFADNARTGIDIVGGTSIDVAGVKVRGGDMGIVLDDGPRDVSITDSRIDAVTHHAVSVRDDSARVDVSGNTISDVEIGVYVRNATADVRSNEVSGASIHGIALAGRVGGGLVTGNTLSGNGPTAIDDDRAIDARVEGNLVDGWAASRTLEQILTAVMQPLTIVWLLIVTLVIVALITRLGGGRKHGDPLRDPRPLQSLSRGIVSRTEAAAMPRR